MAIVTGKYCTISVCCTLFVVILATTVRTSFGEGRGFCGSYYPCKNDGSCTDTFGGAPYVCHCPGGYQGVDCETEINECESLPCANNATCHDEVNNFTCTCMDGFIGSLCEININECESSPCSNNATCKDEINSFTCSCKDGFEGQLCETDINECESSPCSNNATCKDEINSFKCSCKDGFEGQLCETDINECESSPCSNLATCHDEINSFTCTYVRLQWYHVIGLAAVVLGIIGGGIWIWTRRNTHTGVLGTVVGGESHAMVDLSNVG